MPEPETLMNSQTDAGTAKHVVAGTARRLKTPRAAKSLPEQQTLDEATLQPKEPVLPMPQPLFHHVDRHVHSLGYGIDE